MSDTSERSFAGPVIVGVAVLANLMLTVFLIQQVREARREVDALSATLASKQDVAMLRPLEVRHILEERCTTCHTDRRFAKARDEGPEGIAALVGRMQRHPGAVIPDDERPSVEAALLVFRCTACHGDAVLSRMVLMPYEERVRFLRRKVRMPESGFRLDQVGALLAAFETLEDGRR